MANEKRARDMTAEEYAEAHRAAINPRREESKREPKPASKMTPEQYAAAKKKYGLR